MASNFLWGAVGSVINLLTTEMNTLASGSMTAMGPEIDNTTNAFQQGKLHLHFASNSLALTAASLCNVYFLSSNAGATYPNFTSGTTPVLARSNYLVGSISLFPGTISAAVLDEWLEGVFIPPGKFKAVLEYIGGGAGTLPSSGNTLDIFPTPSQY